MGRATALSLPDISEFDDEAMIANHKTIAIVKHRDVGHEQHVPDLALFRHRQSLA